MIYTKFITQQDEVCYACGKELPTGSNCMIDEEQAVLCIECYDKSEYNQKKEEDNN